MSQKNDEQKSEQPENTLSNESPSDQPIKKSNFVSHNTFGPSDIEATPRDRNSNLSESPVKTIPSNENAVPNTLPKPAPQDLRYPLVTESEGNCECEASSSSRPPIDQELYNYHHKQTLLCANRDGDLYYIECPSCHSTNVHRRTFVGCRSCHTQFQLYFEDGCRTQDIHTDLSNLSARGDKTEFVEIKRPNRRVTDAHIWHPRNEKRFKELQDSHPEARKLTLYRDLQKDGKDGHGHSPYTRFAIIPLD